MTKRNTRSALLVSALAMFLCLTMFVGTTFAWFTDTVTSANNVIVAGNLDVKFYWSTDASTWNEVDANTNIFTAEKWEPGHTEVVYLKVENAGSLALKYQLGINVVSETAGVNVAGDTFKLSNYIQFGVVETETAYADRAAARAAVTDAKVISAGYTKAANLVTTGETDTVALVVYMPETVTNEANHNGTEPQIQIGLNVTATQLAHEFDSFDNQYDANAAFSTWDGTIPNEMPKTLEIDPATRTITVNDAAAFAYLHTLDDVWVGLYSNGQGTDYSNYATQNGGKGTDYYYHWVWDVKLACDIDLANKAWTPLNLSFFSAFDGQGHTVKNISIKATGTEGAGLFAFVQGGISNLTVENVSVNAPSINSVGAVAGTAHSVISNVTVKGAIVTGNKYVGGIVGYGYADVINSAVYDSVITVPEGGLKEAGGLAGYLCNHTSVNGNVVKDCMISAPTVASALVSQPQGDFVISFNTVENVTVTTADDTADIFVSNNVGGTSTVVNNTEVSCTVNKTGTLPAVVDNPNDLAAAANVANATVIVAPGTYTTVSLGDGATIIGSEGTVIEQVGTSTDGGALGSTKNTTIKNVEFVGTNAQRWGYAGGDVVFENCTFKGEGTDSLSWAIHYDGTSGANIIYKNCDIYGWVAIGGGANSIVFDGCNFYGNGAFGLCRSYADFTVKNCTFDYSDVDPNGTRSVGIEALSGATVTIENCTNVNGDIKEVISFKYAGTQYEGNVILDGVPYTPAP